MSEQPFEGWAVLEIFGHRRLAGMVRDVEMFGGRLCRIDIPDQDGGTVATQFYGVTAIFCVTPTTEEIARKVAGLSRVEPVTPWELRAIEAPRPYTDGGEDDDWVDRDEDDEVTA